MPKPDASNPLLEAALGYTRRGWPVFPCSPRDKTPLLAADRDGEGKKIRGTGGLSKASTDEERIRGWWRKWPAALPAIATGHPTLDAGGLRMFVVDFDPRTEDVVDEGTGEVLDSRQWTLEQLKAETEAQIGAALPQSLAAITPSVGVHLYLLMPDDGGPPINNRGNLPLHVDVRGLGGYVIAPPAVMAPDAIKGQGGRSYRWLRGGADVSIAEASPELIATLRAPKAVPARPDGGVPTPSPSSSFPAPIALGDDPRAAAIRKFALSALDEECRILAGTPLGSRNNQSNSSGFVIGQLVGAGAISEAVARSSLYQAVGGFNEPDKARVSIDNGLAAGMRPENARDLSNVGTHAARRGGSGPSRAAGGAPRPPSPPPPADEPAPPHPAVDAQERQAFQSGGVEPDGAGAAPTPESGGAGRVVAALDPERDRKCAFLPMTDLGNAERFRLRHAHRFRFCRELGWFVWDGRRHRLLSEEKDKVPGEVQHAVFETVRAIRNEADLIAESGLKEEDPDDESRLDWIVKVKGTKKDPIFVYFSDVLRDHAKSSEGASRLGCIANLAKAFPEIAIEADAMDRDRMAINVLNGTVRLVNAGNRLVTRLDPHDPRDLISKIANVVYDPDATCAEYDSFIEQVQPVEEDRLFLDQWGGLSLTGDISEQKLAFFHGKGRNGKSTLVDTWSFIAGDYGGSVPIETFLDQGRGRKGGEATPDLARLPGVRFLRTSEPEKGAKLAEALIKLVTGGEEITARHLNKGFFDFLPSFKLTVSGNHKPKITGHDDGIWRRVMLVPWEVQIDKDKVDKGMLAKLRKEASGIFNRLLGGLLDVRMNGLIEPQSVRVATRKYREASDQLGRFLEECCVHTEGAKSPSAELFALFTAWSKANGAAEWTQVGFSGAMEDRGYEKKHSNGAKWLNIEMVKTPQDFAESAGSPSSAEERGSGAGAGPVGPQDDVPPW